MNNKLILILFLFFFFKTPAQNTDYAVVFYNAENLFDWKDDPKTNDDEFTPGGDRHWTYKRFQHKIQNTSKTLMGAVGWDVPVLIGLCEVENRYVLEKLIDETALKSKAYKIIHKESPDGRGIDVAMLYNAEVFYPLEYDYFPLLNEDGSIRETREILYVKGVIANADTIHVFMNHWPSRYSGLLETRPLRNKAAVTLRQKVDAVFLKNPKAKIIVMGDFNDQPQDESIRDYLKADSFTKTVAAKKLYNLSVNWLQPDKGTLKYQSQWFVFDQVIVSGALINAEEGVFTQPDWAEVYNESFLLEADQTYGGLKPSRTYIGYRYNGGFGDHLPVKLTLRFR